MFSVLDKCSIHTTAVLKFKTPRVCWERIVLKNKSQHKKSDTELCGDKHCTVLKKGGGAGAGCSSVVEPSIHRALGLILTTPKS